MADTIIELVDLTKMYGTFTAVSKLSLSIRKGEVFGLLGPNGAGKSTTILMMLGLTEPTSGSVRVCGINPITQSVEVKRHVGYLPEDVGFYEDRSGLENLIYTGQLNRMSIREATQKAEALLNRVGLADAITKKTGKYSRGMRQRLGLADVLIKNPEIIILDEPTLGIDPKGVREFINLIVSLSKEEGITVLFSSHHLHQVQQVCDRVGLFVSGKLLAEGDIQTLSQQLFSSSPYLVELGVRQSGTGVASVPDASEMLPWLKKMLSPLEDVSDISMKNDVFQIHCLRDLSSEIARTVVQSGAELMYLNKKEYGLDDIYYRYFEGGGKHE